MLAQLNANIIARAEFRHQRHVIRTSRSGWPWIIVALIMLIPALAGSVWYYGAALLGYDALALSNSTNWLLSRISFIIDASVMTMNFALYFVVNLIALGLAANSIRRERTARTWETLLLTNIHARQLVLGKWWASLRAVWVDHLMVAVVRLGLIGVLVIGSPDARMLALLLGLGLAALTVVEAASTAALGIVSGLLRFAGSVAVFITAVRIVSVILLIAAVIYPEVTAFGRPTHRLDVFIWLGGFLIVFAGLTVVTLKVAEALAVHHKFNATGSPV